MTSPNDAADVVEIRDPSIDSESIMRRIRENIRNRRVQAEARGLNYDALSEGLYAPGVSSRFNQTLYYDLRRMNAAYTKLGVGLSLTEARVPLVGPLLQRLRRALHQLVIYYVNMLAGQQARYDEYAVRALSTLVRDLEDSPNRVELDALRKEVADLRAQIASLEADLPRSRA